MVAMAWLLLAGVALAWLALMGALLRGTDGIWVGIVRAVVGSVFAVLVAGALVAVVMGVMWAVEVIW